MVLRHMAWVPDRDAQDERALMEAMSMIRPLQLHAMLSSYCSLVVS